MSEIAMDINQVLEYLPHRYPFLLIDRVLEYKAGDYLVAIKNVTINEPFFPGHFPNRPVMPGVLITEALAQATGILAFKTGESKPDQNSLYYLVGIDKARFKRPVIPGDQLELTVRCTKQKQTIWCFAGEAKVDGRLVAKADLMCAEQDISA